MTRQSPLHNAQQIAENPVVVECLWLVKNGVPFDVAFSLDDDSRTAFAVVFAEFEGASFDWNTGSYRERD